jgi:ABC-type phosphate transport system substrate-binding protein
MGEQARHWLRAASLLLGLLLCDPLSARDEIAVIVANDSPEVAVDRVKMRDIYLKKILMDADGKVLIPVNLPPEHPLRRSLTETLFNKSAQQLQDYWNQRYFHGITPPYVLHSQEAVVQFVAKTPGAIGYIAACRLDERVKWVLKLNAPVSQRQAVAELCLADKEAE